MKTVSLCQILKMSAPVLVGAYLGSMNHTKVRGYVLPITSQSLAVLKRSSLTVKYTVAAIPMTSGMRDRSVDSGHCVAMKSMQRRRASGLVPPRSNQAAAN